MFIEEDHRYLIAGIATSKVNTPLLLHYINNENRFESHAQALRCILKEPDVGISMFNGEIDIILVDKSIKKLMMYYYQCKGRPCDIDLTYTRNKAVVDLWIKYYEELKKEGLKALGYSVPSELEGVL
jgi:hypothetical protein